MVDRANVVDGDTENVDCDLRERPFNLKGGYVFFLKKYSDSLYNLMWDSGKKFRVLREKKKNILTLVLSEIFFLNESKNHNPPLPFKLNDRYLKNEVSKDFNYFHFFS